MRSPGYKRAHPGSQNTSKRPFVRKECSKYSTVPSNPLVYNGGPTGVLYGISRISKGWKTGKLTTHRPGCGSGDPTSLRVGARHRRRRRQGPRPVHAVRAGGLSSLRPGWVGEPRLGPRIQTDNVHGPQLTSRCSGARGSGAARSPPSVTVWLT